MGYGHRNISKWDARRGLGKGFCVPDTRARHSGRRADLLRASQRRLSSVKSTARTAPDVYAKPDSRGTAGPRPTSIPKLETCERNECQWFEASAFWVVCGAAFEWQQINEYITSFLDLKNKRLRVVKLNDRTARPVSSAGLERQSSPALSIYLASFNCRVEKESKLLIFIS